MIRLLTAETEWFLQHKENTFGVYETKIYSQYEIYGEGTPLLDLWTLEQDGRVIGLLSRLDDALTIAAPADVDLAECAAFVRTLGCATVEGLGALIDPLNAVIHGELHSSWILRHSGAAALCADGVPGSIERAEMLSEVYHLHCVATPGFSEAAGYAAWLTEASHKQRHGLAEYFLLKVEDAPVATASILFHGKGQAIISAVATHPAFRGQGYGGMVVAHALRVCAENSWQAWLLTREDALLDFYEPLGFVPTERWGRIHLK